MITHGNGVAPEAFRLNQVIEGWQLALQEMRVGDRWIIYIPYNFGYGNRASGPIPAFSTLIFEVELLGSHNSNHRIYNNVSEGSKKNSHG